MRAGSGRPEARRFGRMTGSAEELLVFKPKLKYILGTGSPRFGGSDSLLGVQNGTGRFFVVESIGFDAPPLNEEALVVRKKCGFT